MDLGTLSAPNHNGGKLAIGPDRYLYAVIGNLNAGDDILQNDKNGRGLDNASVIFRINPDDGSAAPKNPFSGSTNNNDDNNTNEILSKYYAYGIRNSFGITFDPVTGRLWDTENGETGYDEINLVMAGFNSVTISFLFFFAAYWNTLVMCSSLNEYPIMKIYLAILSCCLSSTSVSKIGSEYSYHFSFLCRIYYSWCSTLTR